MEFATLFFAVLFVISVEKLLVLILTWIYAVLSSLQLFKKILTNLYSILKA